MGLPLTLSQNVTRWIAHRYSTTLTIPSRSFSHTNRTTQQNKFKHRCRHYLRYVRATNQKQNYLSIKHLITVRMKRLRYHHIISIKVIISDLQSEKQNLWKSSVKTFDTQCILRVNVQIVLHFSRYNIYQKLHALEYAKQFMH